MDPSGNPNPLNASVLVLNKFYAAVRIVSARRAFSLLFKRNAQAVENDQSQFGNFDFEQWLSLSARRASGRLDHEEFVHTPRFPIMIPRVIRLVNYQKLPRREIKFNRKNLLARDGHHCQYCGKKFPVSKLTIDHIIPKSRGGKSGWTNVVTSCMACNSRKGGKQPHEAGMKLIHPPGAPKTNPVILDKIRNERYQMWKSFLTESDLGLDIGI